MTRRRLLSLLAGLSILPAASCAPVVMPAGPKITQSHIETDAVIMSDGARLPLQSWLPAGQPRAIVLAIHGFNDYSHAFDNTGLFLAARGIAVYAYDQRGFGRAPDPGLWPGEATLIKDLDTVTRLFVARNPGIPFYLMGESMGGAEVMVAMTQPNPPPHVSGVILSAPAVWDRSHMNIPERVALWVGGHMMPWLTLTGGSLNIVPSDNNKMLEELWNDPLVIKATRADAISGLADLMDDAQEAAAKLDVPTLMLYGERDEIVPAAPSYQAMSVMPGRPVLALYPHGYHMLTRDLDADVVLGDIASWIISPGSPLPSGGDQRARTRVAAYRTGTAG